MKVVPGSSRSCLAGWLGDTLKLRVAAPPERGKANAAVCELLEQALSLPSGSARVVAGQTSPRKTVEIAGLSDAELREKLKAQNGGRR